MIRKGTASLPGSEAVPFLIMATAAVCYGVFLAERSCCWTQGWSRVHVQVVEGATPWLDECISLLVEQMELGSGLKTLQVDASRCVV